MDQRASLILDTLSDYDEVGNKKTTETYGFQIKDLVTGDINGYGIVNILDLAAAAQHFGEEIQDP